MKLIKILLNLLGFESLVWVDIHYIAVGLSWHFCALMLLDCLVRCPFGWTIVAGGHGCLTQRIVSAKVQTSD